MAWTILPKALWSSSLWMLAFACCYSGEEPAERPLSGIEVLKSGPWDNAYSALDATETHTWVLVRSSDFSSLQPNERLKVWLQWAPSTDGPWKTRAKGEVEVRSKRNYAGRDEHERLKTRGNLKKSPENDDQATLKSNPLTLSHWGDSLPYFRVAEALRRPGKTWTRLRRHSLQPSDNEGIFSAPFQAHLDIVYAYLPGHVKKEGPPPRYDTTDIHSGQPGPWTHLSFAPKQPTCVSFFVGLGGTNIGSIVPTHPFEVHTPVGSLEFWSCHEKPKGFREQPPETRSYDTVWWGVCPLRVPLPPPGEAVLVEVRTTFYGHDYVKTFQIFGEPLTPENAAQRKTAKAEYDHLVAKSEPKDMLYTVVLAKNLQNWNDMHAQLDAYYKLVQSELTKGTITQREADHLLKDSFPIPGDESVSFLNLLKEWAWTMSNPSVYQQALVIKKTLLSRMEQRATSAADHISPQEYRELAELIVERTSERNEAESLWRKGDDLIINPASPFYNAATDERQLRLQRPGWWPE